MIAAVIRLSNDMVLVFDENGDELPEYQGWYKDVKDKVLDSASAGTVFKHWYGDTAMPAVVEAGEW